MIFKAAIYCRLSNEDGDKEQSDSIKNQIEIVRSFIKKEENILEIGLYIDDGYTGMNFDRPDFQRMMNDIIKGDINTVITKDQSRLGREHIETSNYLEKVFPTLGVRYISVLDNYDSLTGSNEDIAPFKSLINDMYSKDISKKVRGAFDAKRKQGNFIGAFAPYGYKKDPNNKNKLVIDEYAAKIVRKIFNYYLSGIGKQGIARRLNKEGIICPSEYKKEKGLNYVNANKLDSTVYWTYSSINRILKNEVYIGHMVQKKQEKISYKINKKRDVDKEDQIRVKNTHEPIIDKETFYLAQKLGKTQTRKLKFNEKVTIFAGLLKCADCKRAMSKTTNKWKGKETVYYVCGTYKQYGKKHCSSHRIREDILSNIILEEIKKEAKKALTQQDIEKLEKSYKDKKHGSNVYLTNVRKLEDKISSIRRYKQKALESYTDEILTKKEYLTYKQLYDKQEQELEGKIKELEKLQEENKEKKEQHEEWVHKFINYINIKELNREILIELVEEILIHKNQSVEIRFRFSSTLD